MEDAALDKRCELLITKEMKWTVSSLPSEQTLAQTRKLACKKEFVQT